MKGSTKFFHRLWELRRLEKAFLVFSCQKSGEALCVAGLTEEIFCVTFRVNDSEVLSDICKSWHFTATITEDSRAATTKSFSMRKKRVALKDWDVDF